jgi:hypothetical protein
VVADNPLCTGMAPRPARATPVFLLFQAFHTMGRKAMARNQVSSDFCLDIKSFDYHSTVTVADAALPATAPNAISPFVSGSVQEPRKPSRLELMSIVEPLSVF